MRIWYDGGLVAGTAFKIKAAGNAATWATPYSTIDQVRFTAVAGAGQGSAAPYWDLGRFVAMSDAFTNWIRDPSVLAGLSVRAVFVVVVVCVCVVCLLFDFVLCYSCAAANIAFGFHHHEPAHTQQQTKTNKQAVLTLEQPWGYANASVEAAPQNVWLEWVKTNWFVMLRAAFTTAGTYRWEVKYTTPTTGAQTQRVFR